MKVLSKGKNLRKSSKALSKPSLLHSKIIKKTSTVDVEENVSDQTVSKPSMKKDWINLHSDVNKSVSEVSTQSLSKGQKKRALKKTRVLTKIGHIQPVFTNNISSKKPAVVQQSNLKMFSELEKSVMEYSQQSGSGGSGTNSSIIRPASLNTNISNKMKKTLAVREVERMKLVQQHPMYQSDPLGAITSHLQSILAMRSAAAVANSNSNTPSTSTNAGSISQDSKSSGSGSKGRSHGKQSKPHSTAAMDI